MHYFVIVYEQHSGVVEVEEFDEHAGRLALDRRFALERENRLRLGIEVVMLTAESESALRRTHGRYFKKVGELVPAD